MKRYIDLSACIVLAMMIAAGLASCTKWTYYGSGISGGSGDDGDTPGFDGTISGYAGEMADDAADDIVGTDGDLYWEANSFTDIVYVTYNGDVATVKASNSKILYNVDGAYVTVDMLTNSVKNVDIVVTGQSDDGQLKIYGEKKFKLTLSGMDLTCRRGPAINDQCKKRVFVHLKAGTTNILADAASYSDEPYYLNGASPADEDRKGCFFSEGNMIFSGTGVLVVDGRMKHGIATDGYFYIRPGATIAVNDAAKNAIHVKGDTADNIGIYMVGGLIYANTTATAGKGIKTDFNAEIAGGRLILSTSGGSEYDSEERDTSSPAGIKADGNVIISGGTHVLKSTGTGGKGISAGGTLEIAGGSTTITTAGGKYTYSSSLTSSPKGIKADGDINIRGGQLNISVTGASDASEGLESKSSLNISGGEVYIYAYDDAINASSAVNISGGKVYAYSSSSDGIDSNGTLTVSGGLVIGVGAGSPECGLDCDSSNNFKINGGTVIGAGGSMMASPSSSSQQRCVIYNGLSLTKGVSVCILNSSGVPLMSFEIPRTMSGMSLLFSSADLVAGTYTVSTGGTMSGATDTWNGWATGGTWSGGSQTGTFTSSGTVTTVGNGGMGGGFPGGGGGFPGGGPRG